MLVTVYYLDKNVRKKRIFLVPEDEYTTFVDLLEQRGCWYTIDKMRRHNDNGKKLLESD